MRHLLIAFALLLYASIAHGGFGYGRVIGRGTPAASTATCNSTAFYTKTATDSNNQVLTSGDYTFFGGIWSGTTFTVCKVGAKVEVWVGDVSSKNYRIEVWSMSGTSLNTMKGSSDIVSGSVFPLSAGIVDFSFSTPVEVSTGDAIVLVDQTKTVDTSNYIRAYRTSSDDYLNFRSWKADKTNVGYNENDTITPSFTMYKYE